LLSVNEERNTVEVIWDDGVRREFKWSSLVWGKTEGQMVGQKPTIEAPPPPPLEPTSECFDFLMSISSRIPTLPLPSEHGNRPSLNVPFAPGHSSPFATPTATTPIAGQALPTPVATMPAPTQLASYSPYAIFNSASGQFRYGTWANGFYS